MTLMFNDLVSILPLRCNYLISICFVPHILFVDFSNEFCQSSSQIVFKLCSFHAYLKLIKLCDVRVVLRTEYLSIY